MEDFYPFTNEELPELSDLVKKEDGMFQSDVIRSGGNGTSFLLPLVVDLLNDVDRIRKLKNSFVKVYGPLNKAGRVSENFLKIVKEWLEENGGRGNLLRITEALQSNGHTETAQLLEQLFLRYSLPMSAKDEDGHNNHVYSLSTNFLQVKETKNHGSGSDFATNMSVIPSVKRALQNSVILEEVFKKLQTSEQKTFRLVTTTWMKETFSYWRNSAQLRVQVSEDDDDLLTGEKNGITMSSYVKMVKFDGKLKGLNYRTARGRNFELTTRPFHCYKLSYEHLGGYGREGTPFLCGSIENKFWNLCGPQIEDLQIDHAMFDLAGDDNLYKICERLLLHTCQNLKKLNISESCATQDDRVDSLSSSDSEMEVRRKDDKTPWYRKTFFRKQDMAGKLHTLTIAIETTAENMGKILFICPKIKTLVLFVFGEKITGLLRPTASGEYIKLENLTLHYCFANEDDDKFVELRDYTKLLTNKQFNSLKHLHLDGIYLSDARRSPFDLYAALAHCSSGLKSLNLNLLVAETDDLEGAREWFTDLSSLSFPHLTVLKICIEFKVRVFHSYKNMKFDFRTLKGMRMLEQFEIMVINNGEFRRNPGAQDWICEGDRNNYLPSGVALDYSDANPILCKNLKKFTFRGWGLNKEDIPLLSSWFPNLTQLAALVYSDAVPLLLENWDRLEKIEMETERLISLRELRPLKEKRKHLRIIQTILWSGGLPRLVELKETNGMLYFYEDLVDEDDE